MKKGEPKLEAKRATAAPAEPSRAEPAAKVKPPGSKAPKAAAKRAVAGVQPNRSRRSATPAQGRPPASERPIDQVKVSDGALATIIGLAAHEVPGVVGMAPASLSEGIRRILGVRQVDEGVVLAHPTAPERADVDLHVVVAFGVNIPAVADSIRQRVRYAAQHFAGIELDEVRVHVDGVSRAQD